ncbi:MAG: hypothetical protein AAF353_15035 [Pseudomonadota bacterium]
MGYQNQKRALGLVRLTLIIASILFPTLATAAEPLSILTQNLNQLFDHIDDGNREKIVSRGRYRQKIRGVAKNMIEEFKLPHIIAVQEVENLRVLRDLAAELYGRSGAIYQSVLMPGLDVSGIDVGFLVNTNLKIEKVEQLFFNQQINGGDTPLFSRPPLLLRVCRVEKCLSLVNLHMRSMRGISSERRGERVRHKRQQQAETLARWINRFQSDQPSSNLMILGDFNALTPSDKHVDVAGILRGNPDQSRPQLISTDLIKRDLVDLTLLIPQKRRYSYIFRQKKQQLDYLLLNQTTELQLESIGFGRINYRVSDHAGLIAEFSW